MIDFGSCVAKLAAFPRLSSPSISCLLNIFVLARSLASVFAERSMGPVASRNSLTFPGGNEIRQRIEPNACDASALEFEPGVIKDLARKDAPDRYGKDVKRACIRSWVAC